MTEEAARSKAARSVAPRATPHSRYRTVSPNMERGQQNRVEKGHGRGTRTRKALLPTRALGVTSG